MNMQFFTGRGRHGETVQLPRAYMQHVKWVPRIGDIFPNFSAHSTHGPLEFHRWAEGSWVMLFSHPAAFTSVCTTEIAGFALAQDEFAARGVRLMALSRDTTETHRRWVEDIERMFEIEVPFPLIEDETGYLSSAFSMIHPNEGGHHAVRKSIIIDPALRVRMIFEYPYFVGRSTDETLRVIDALQTQDRHGVATGGDWHRGEDCLLPPHVGDARARFLYGERWTKFCDYLRTVSVEDD